MQAIDRFADKYWDRIERHLRRSLVDYRDYVEGIAAVNLATWSPMAVFDSIVDRVGKARLWLDFPRELFRNLTARERQLIMEDDEESSGLGGSRATVEFWLFLEIDSVYIVDKWLRNLRQRYRRVFWRCER